MADLHLGFRRHHATAKGGFNQREMDVAAAFTRAINKTIEIAPDVVVIAGDVFHSVRPPCYAVEHAMREFKRLRDALTSTDVVVVAGNHDTPRTKDIASPLPIFDTLGILVVRSTTRIVLRDGELALLCVPDHSRPKPEFIPDASARYNVLLIHDQVQGDSNRYGPIRKPDAVEPSDLNAPAFDYVALGDYHVYQEIAPNAYYSGAIEYTSSNIWREVDEESSRPEELRGKGIIERNLATGEHRFHLIPSVRRIVDLPVINAFGMTSAQVTELIITQATDIDRQLVRQVVTDIPKPIVRDLDHRAIRKVKARALNYLLDTRNPEIIEAISVGSLASKRRMSIPDFVRSELDKRELTPGVDRADLIALAMHALELADEKVTSKSVGDAIEAAA